MSINKCRFIVLFFILFQFLYLFLVELPQLIQVNATLTSAKDTLSNSRLSHRSQVVSGASGTGLITIGAGQSDTDTQNIFPRDNICFANSGLNGCEGTPTNQNNTYTVGAIPTYNGTIIELSSVLTSALVSTDIAVSSQSATHTVVFTTANTVNNPIFEVRIPAKTQTSASNDGFPDFGASAVAGTSGFDLAGVVAGDVTCSTGTASVTSSASSGGNYHSIKCTVTGTVNSSTVETITIGSTHKIVNPAPVTSGHSRGAADVYNVTINEYDSGGTNVVDDAIISIAPVEGVLVSATVQNTLTFSIAADSSGNSRCGKTNSVSTTATTVPFGTITSGSFYNAAHLLSVSTNAANGYVVTVQENGALSIDGLGVTTLADTACPPNTCTTTAWADWTTTSTSGFGYSLANSSGTDATFLYNTSATFNARPFDSSTPRTIMGNSAPVSGSAAYVCYQIATSGTQKAGYYLNKLTYIATPTF